MLIHELLASATPAKLLHQARQDGRLAAELPELDCLYGIPQPPEHHPEVDTGRHIELVAEQATHWDDLAVRYAALMHDLGKAVTPQANWPRHQNHEELGVDLVNAVSARIAASPAWARLAAFAALNHLKGHRSLELTPRTLIKLFDAAQGDVHFLAQFGMVCWADATGREGMANRAYPQQAYMSRVWAALEALGPVPAEATEAARFHPLRVRAVRALERG